MSFLKLNLKKIMKEKSNLLPVVLFAIFVLVMYFFQFRNIQFMKDNPAFNGENEYLQVGADIEFFKNELTKTDLDQETIRITKENLKMAETRLHWLGQKLDAYKQADWKRYYEANYQLDIIKQSVLGINESYKELLKETIDLNIKYNQYQAIHGSGFDDRLTATQGISFSVDVLQSYYPIGSIMIVCFICANLLTSFYKTGFDKRNLLPLSWWQQYVQSLKAILLVWISIFASLFLLIILIGSVVSSSGTINTPVLTYDSMLNASYQSFSNYLFSLIIMSLLSVWFIYTCVLLLSMVTKKQFITLFSSLVVVLGGYLIVSYVIPLFNIAHLLPFTYLNILDSVTGVLSKVTGNSHINFQTGLLVMVVSNVIMSWLIVLIQRKGD